MDGQLELELNFLRSCIRQYRRIGVPGCFVSNVLEPDLVVLGIERMLSISSRPVAARWLLRGNGSLLSMCGFYPALGGFLLLTQNEVSAIVQVIDLACMTSSQSIPIILYPLPSK